MSNIKSTNALMKYLRKVKLIEIGGAREKNVLLNIGYYHAYKGCRFYREKKNAFLITKFTQLEAIYNFDSKLKGIIYPHIMFIETALKNRTLQNIVEYGNSFKFYDLLERCFDGYKDYPVQTEQHMKFIRKREQIKAKIYNTLAQSFDNRIISHFYQKDDQVPIWALFEILTLGDFSKLYECLNQNLRLKISEELKINRTMDNDGKIVSRLIFALKDLRNSVAHNNFIYDNRFKTSEVGFRIEKYFKNELGIPDVNFHSIVDYVILIGYLLKILKVKKTEIRRLTKQFKDICNEFYEKIESLSIYNKVIPTNAFNKLKIFEKNI